METSRFDPYEQQLLIQAAIEEVPPKTAKVFVRLLDKGKVPSYVIRTLREQIETIRRSAQWRG